MTRVTLRLAALLVSMLVVAGLAVPTVAAGQRSQGAWAGTYNLYSDGVFVSQYRWTWCVGASSQAMLNIIHDTTHHGFYRQKKLVKYAMNHDQFLYSNKGGSDAVGWAATLTQFGGGSYAPVKSNSYKQAVRRAVKQLRKTGRPVGLLVMGGRHAWVLNGFDATADPALTNSFAVTGLYVMGPLYPMQQKGWFDKPPNTRLTWKQLKQPFHVFDDPDSPSFNGYWVTVNPY